MKNFKSRKCVKNFTFEKYNARKEHASRANCFRTKEVELEKIIIFSTKKLKFSMKISFVLLRKHNNV